MGQALRQLWNARALVYVLVVRELKARYRGSVLGFLWSLMNPLLMLAIYGLVFAFILEQRDPSMSPYVLYLASGLLPWMWLSSSVLQSCTAILDGSALIRKVVFPAEVLPIVYILSNGVHFVLSLLIYLAFAVAFHLRLHVSLISLPLIVAAQLIFTTALGLVLSALTVYFRDLRDLVGNLLTLWFFSSPVIYSMDLPAIRRSAALATLLRFNPATHLLESYHAVLFYGRWPDWSTWAVFTAGALLMFGAAYGFFHRLRDTLVEEV
ncbi:Teichoic acid translocation permease protein TagG [bacterium HR11]|nr:Teichoic acid translocation permease protein TagG [bacterium HR11]